MGFNSGFKGLNWWGILSERQYEEKHIIFEI
jgi:hypothetical protein